MAKASHRQGHYEPGRSRGPGRTHRSLNPVAEAEVFRKFAELARAKTAILISRVWSFALHHTFNRFDAEDLAQEILLAVCQDLAHLREPEAFWRWLLSVERHVAARWHARRRRELALLAPWDTGWEAGSAAGNSAPGNVVLLTCLTAPCPPCEEGVLDSELKQRLAAAGICTGLPASPAIAVGTHPMGSGPGARRPEKAG